MDDIKLGPCSKCLEFIKPCSCQTGSGSAVVPGYVAFTYEQHPLSGAAIPVCKKVTAETTIAELAEWYREVHPKGKHIYDLRICEAT
jgi:hypothetical protein